MAVMVVGLVYLCFMRFAWTQEDVGRTTLEGTTKVESEIGIFLFQMMDMQITRDNKVTFAEFYQLWWSADSNNDNLVSTQEVNTLLEEHLLGPSSYAERMFGEQDLKNTFGLKLLFGIFDKNKDDIIKSAEFYTAYMTIFNPSLVLSR